MLYVFVDIKIDSLHFVETVRANLDIKERISLGRHNHQPFPKNSFEQAWLRLLFRSDPYRIHCEFSLLKVKIVSFQKNKSHNYR